MSAVLNRIEEFESALPESEARRAAVLRMLISALRSFSANAADDSKFCSLLKHSQSVIELDDDELGDILKVSRTTVGRWSRGVTAPHAIMQESVFKTIARFAESKLKHHRAS